MKVSEIKEIITLFDESSLSQLKIQSENFSLKLDKNAKIPTIIESKVLDSAPLPQVLNTAPAINALNALNANLATPARATPATNNIESTPQTNAKKDAEFITSPMVGTFYRSPSPGAAPYVSIGDTIKKGQTIGIVEAMKIMNEIEAEFNCKIVEIEVNDAQPVEFGTKLIMVERV